MSLRCSLLSISDEHAWLCCEAALSVGVATNAAVSCCNHID